ncbi:MAG: beta-ketoacyl synthase N-terminal-like domain-containing protein [Gemmatimonadaceae bacterium]
MSTREPIVVTGIGVMTCVGLTRTDFWHALTNGISGIGPITSFDASSYETRIAGEIRNFDPLAYLPRKLAGRMGRNSQLAAAAAIEAVKDAGLDLTREVTHRVGCCIGCAAGDYNELEAQHKNFLQRGPNGVSPFCVPKVIPNMPTCNAAIALGVHGPNFAAVSACASGAHSIGMAMSVLRAGQADVMLAGGAESTMTAYVLNGYAAMGALSSATTRRPQRADRSTRGATDSSWPRAPRCWCWRRWDTRRGAEPIAELAGFGHDQRCVRDRPARSQRPVGGDGDAHGDGRCRPGAVGRGVRECARDVHQANDRSESRAILSLFAPAPPVSSIKSMVGHALGAAGAIEAAATALTVHHGVIPPTINHDEPDPDCPLDVVPNVARAVTVHAAISNSFGFGGQNGVLAFRKVG